MSGGDHGFETRVRHSKLDFPAPGAAERARCWMTAIEKNNLPWTEHTAEQLAMNYHLPRSRINAVLQHLRLRLNGNGQDPERSLDLLRQIMSEYFRQPLDEMAKRIEPAFGWEDLILPRTVTDHLRAYRNMIAHQFTVYEKWRLGSKMPRGRGAVALFSGSSGTGKTMAAEVIARDLGINLYRIDLAGLVSKYIGETEKNLKKVFDSAGGNTLLFFDEADSLFGRRTEIKDSHDRYANLEVNYLLQRLEDHDGPVVMATNIRKNLDEAFLRRIHFIIEFPQPSDALRRIIFQKYLPSTMPLAEDLDLDFLARHFEISGGDIKNVAVQAAFMAAEEGGPVAMEHLLTALKREYLKIGKLYPGSQVSHLMKTQPDSPQNRRRMKEVGRLGP
jgi:SpoVK/Ycf46/Vps4 family AAA+-type ATPase